jgi:hypothetical protein
MLCKTKELKVGLPQRLLGGKRYKIERCTLVSFKGLDEQSVPACPSKDNNFP